MATTTATSTTTDDTALSYFQILGKCEETDDSSYTRTTADGTQETISKVQLSLVIPGMQDRVRVELPLELAPSTDLLSQWELEESWLVVSATGMRALAFKRRNARPGEKEVGSLVVFAGASVREATGEERKQLQAARKAQKVAAKQRRAARTAEKNAAKVSDQATAQQSA
jgi:regulator of protease activity HflC (stomatin/prohibitin superfamily)